MPFQSKVQERWMWANHPQMAKRWAALTDQKSLPERKGDSRGLPPKKLPGLKRDFAKLVPGQKARHTISKPANEVEAMSEGDGVKFQLGPVGRLGKPKAHTGLKGRDVRAAAIKKARR